MSGFPEVEVPRGQLVLGEQRLDDATPPDHPVRHEWTLVCTAVNVGILLRHWKEVAAGL